ncbi:hypothetical protein VNO78_17851 [Psophocarpus tetragonolobus]|uniref:Uncharacterized protein n=1 Tax=Psophocarpus tetragonolobus TaxID=3891 RepID=A0AAN9SHB3_PSOTE
MAVKGLGRVKELGQGTQHEEEEVVDGTMRMRMRRRSVRKQGSSSSTGRAKRETVGSVEVWEIRKMLGVLCENEEMMVNRVAQTEDRDKEQIEGVDIGDESFIYTISCLSSSSCHDDSRAQDNPQMLQVETLVSACAGGSGDRKIACETVAGEHSTDPTEPHPESPPESFWISRDEELDWWERNAVYERKESTKANSSTNLNPATATNNSQRFGLNFKSTIIGLPKPQKTSFVEAKNRRNHKPSNIRLFPKRSASVGKSNSAFVEPSSPKVSCMGRVRSKRDPNRKLTTSLNVTKRGFFGSLRAMFRRQKSPPGTADSNNVASRARHSTSSMNDVSVTLSETEPPGLGAMTRFVSGRRSDSWGVVDSEPHVAQ